MNEAVTECASRVEEFAEKLLSAFLAGRGSTRANGPAPSMDHFRNMARAVWEGGSVGTKVDRKPVNAPSSWMKDDDWLVCACGSFAFNVMKRDSLCHVLCAKCETDHTINVWDPKP